MHRLRLSNAELGRALGITGQATGKYRIGSEPKSKYAVALAQALGVSKEELSDQIANNRLLTEREKAELAQKRAQDTVKPGYTTEEEWSDANSLPRPGDETPEPFAPPGVVLALVFTTDRGEPVYGFDHTGKVHQLGRAIQARIGLSSGASGGSAS